MKAKLPHICSGRDPARPAGCRRPDETGQSSDRWSYPLSEEGARPGKVLFTGIINTTSYPYLMSFMKLQSSNRFVSFSIAERWSLATRGTRERREQRERRGGGAWPRGLVTISSASTGSPDTGTVRSPHQASPVWTEGKT